VVRAERNVFTFGAGVLDVAERAAAPDWIPPYREDKGALGADGLALRSGGSELGPEGEARRDSVDRDERRLGELGRKTVEMLAIAHIFCERLEVGEPWGGGYVAAGAKGGADRGWCCAAAVRRRARAGSAEARGARCEGDSGGAAACGHGVQDSGGPSSRPCTHTLGTFRGRCWPPARTCPGATRPPRSRRPHHALHGRRRSTASTRRSSARRR
jgi:hypothetical protein